MATIAKLAVGLSLNSLGFSSGVIKTGYSLNWLRERITGTSESMESMRDSAERSESSLAKLNDTANKTLMKLVGVASAGAGAGMGIKLAAEAQQMEKAFTTMTRSADAAQKIIGGARTLHSKAPSLPTSDILSGAQSLLAVERPLATILPTMRQLADIAVLTDNNIGELGSSYAKVAAAGKVSGQTLQEFSTRNIPLVALLARSMGRTQTEVRQLVSDGKVGFVDFARAIEDATSAGGLFFEGVESQASLVMGLFGGFKQTVKDTLQAFGEGFMATAGLEQSLEEMIDFAHAMQPIARSVGEFFGHVFAVAWKLNSLVFSLMLGWQVFTTTLGVGLTILKSLFLLKLANWALGFVGLRVGALLFSTAMWAVRAAYHAAGLAAILFHALQGPKGWAVLAGAAVAAGAAIWAYNSASNSATHQLEGVTETTNRFADSVDRLTVGMELVGTIFGWAANVIRVGQIAVMAGFAGIAMAINFVVQSMALLANSVGIHWLDDVAESAKTMTDSLKDSVSDLVEEWMKPAENIQKTADRTKDLTAAQEKLNQKIREQAKAYTESFDNVEKLMNAARGENAMFNMSETERKVREFEEAIYKVNEAMGLANPRQIFDDIEGWNQLADVEAYRSELESLAMLEKEKKLTEEIALIERDARQAGMNDIERRLDDLRAMGAEAWQLADAFDKLQNADKIRKDTEHAETEKKRLEDLAKTLNTPDLTAFDKFENKIEDLKKLYNSWAIDQATFDRASKEAYLDFAKQMDAKANAVSTAAPKAILRGSAEADILASQVANPIKALTKIEEDQLIEARRQSGFLEEGFKNIRMPKVRSIA